MTTRIIGAALLWVTALPAAAAAAAADPGATFLTRLYIDVCVPNIGKPDQVRQWAEQHHLEPVRNPEALNVFVGPGDKGAAWAIPAVAGSFALSLRGTTKACAVWARTADPSEVETYFKRIVEGVKRPGLVVTVDQNKTVPSPSGQARALVYNVTAPNAPTSLEFTMLTAERSGGPFQASVQVATAGPH